MIKFNYEKIMQPNTVVHIKTKKQDKKFRKWLISMGLNWNDGKPYSTSHWHVYRSKFCMNPFSKSYSDITFYEYEGYKIYKYEEVIIYTTKEELKQELKETEEKLKQELKKTEEKLKSIRERLDSIEEENYLFEDDKIITYQELIEKLKLIGGNLRCKVEKIIEMITKML
jgi:hypothetical protein